MLNENEFCYPDVKIPVYTVLGTTQNSMGAYPRSSNSFAHSIEKWGHNFAAFQVNPLLHK